MRRFKEALVAQRFVEHLWGDVLNARWCREDLAMARSWAHGLRRDSAVIFINRRHDEYPISTISYYWHGGGCRMDVFAAKNKPEMFSATIYLKVFLH